MTMEAGNIMNPASIGERFCISCANIGTAYIAPKFPILVRNVISIPQKYTLFLKSRKSNNLFVRFNCVYINDKAVRNETINRINI